MQRSRIENEGTPLGSLQRSPARLIPHPAGGAAGADVADGAAREAGVVPLGKAGARSRVVDLAPASLLRSARHLFAGRERHAEARPGGGTAGESAGAPPPGPSLPGELCDAARAAIDELPPRRREALVLVRLQGLSLEEAARRMGLSQETVAEHITRALDGIAERLDRYLT